MNQDWHLSGCEKDRFTALEAEANEAAAPAEGSGSKIFDGHFLLHLTSEAVRSFLLLLPQNGHIAHAPCSPEKVCYGFTMITSTSYQLNLSCDQQPSHSLLSVFQFTLFPIESA